MPKLKSKYQQSAPYCIQVEPSEGCNLACSFCSMHAIRQHGPAWKTYKFMTVETVAHAAKLIADEGWNPRWEFAMHGEPTLNPKLPQLIAAVRNALPKAYILLTSNGMPLLWDNHGRLLPNISDRQARFNARITELFDAGANTIALDNYAYLKDQVANLARNYAVPGIDVHEYPSGGILGNPHRRAANKKLVVVADISVATNGTHSNVHNQGGTAAPPTDDRKNQRCAKPFREIAIRWDGGIAICCDDWRGAFGIKNINECATIRELWDHPRFMAVRKMLYHKGRVLGPCDGCNARSYRVGLLPDPMGKQTMPEYTADDAKTIELALAEEPLVGNHFVVLRPWELPPK